MIRINDDWVIDVDEHNYILKRDMHIETVRKDGRQQHVYKVEGYFSSPQKALKAFGEEIVRDRLKAAEMGLADAVRTVQDTYEEWRRVVEEAMKGVNDDTD